MANKNRTTCFLKQPFHAHKIPKMINTFITGFLFFTPGWFQRALNDSSFGEGSFSHLVPEPVWKRASSSAQAHQQLTISVDRKGLLQSNLAYRCT